MRFVSGEEIHRVLTFPALVAAMEASHRRPRIASGISLWARRGRTTSCARPSIPVARWAASSSPAFPTTSSPEMETRIDCRRSRRCTCCSMATNGRPLAVLDGTEITWWKTAADSALGARLLAPADPHTLVVVGAGTMAPWLVRAHRFARPSIRRVLVWNRTPARAADLAARLREDGIAAEAAADLETAVRQAQVITSVTRAHTPLIQGSWLQPGAHLDLVGGYTPETREADDVAVRRSRIFVDRLESALDVGDIQQPIASGAIRKEDVLGDLYDLVGGAVPGRLGGSDITLFKNAGGGHLDLMTAEAIMSQLEAV